MAVCGVTCGRDTRILEINHSRDELIKANRQSHISFLNVVKKKTKWIIER